MILSELQKRITEGKIPPVLCLYGEEVGVRDVYIHKIQSVLNTETICVDTVEEAYSKMTKKNITDSIRLFIVRYDYEFIKQTEKTWKKVFDVVDGNLIFLILIFSNLDKRGRFYKQQSEILVEFEKVSDKILYSYIDKILPGLSVYNKQELIELCESSYSKILLELDKIKCYSEAVGANVSVNSVFELLVTDGTINRPIGDITFKLTDAILMRDVSSSVRYLFLAKNKGEPEMVVLSVLYNNFKQILMVQGLGMDFSAAAAKTGLTSWQIKMANEKKGHYSISGLVFGLKKTRFAEMGIKSGLLESSAALDYLVVNLFKEENRI